jgi:hypothetical protein
MSKFSREEILSAAYASYLKSARVILGSDELTDDLWEQLPAGWVELFHADDISSQVSKLWEPVAGRLPLFTMHIRRAIQSIALLVADDVFPRLLYVFAKGDKLRVYQGFLPLDKRSQDTQVFEKIPHDVQTLYSVHDGWIFSLDQKMGHLPHDQWHYLDCYWGQDSELINQVPVDMCKTLVVVQHVNGDALCFEARDDGFVTVKWWSDDPNHPKLGVDFWYEYDKWMSARLEEYDDSSLA